MPQTLEVYGDGQVEVVPDIAYGLVGVTTIGKHVEKASSENARMVEAGLAVVEVTGVDQVNIKTGNFTIGIERNHREEKDRSVHGFNNTVDITVRDLSLIGWVLGTATRAGANEVHGLHMEVAQKREAMVKARSLVVEDARQKAEYLFSLHRVQIGSVLEISEGGGRGRFPLVKVLAMDARSPRGGTAP